MHRQGPGAIRQVCRRGVAQGVAKGVERVAFDLNRCAIPVGRDLLYAVSQDVRQSRAAASTMASASMPAAR